VRVFLEPNAVRPRLWRWRLAPAQHQRDRVARPGIPLSLYRYVPSNHDLIEAMLAEHSDRSTTGAT